MPRSIQPTRLIDYLQYPRNLSWLVARQFEDSFTRDVYFVQQFPFGLPQTGRLFITYKDRFDDSGKRLTDACWMHFSDREITGPFPPAQTLPKCTPSVEEDWGPFGKQPNLKDGPIGPHSNIKY